MSKATARILGLASLLLVAACDHIPLYNESLDWFSWSQYDPEVNAIVSEIPPPGKIDAGPAAGHDAMIGDPAPGPVSGAAVSGRTVSAPTGSTTMAGTTVTTSATTAGSSASSASAPLVGIRNSVGPSVTWRSTRGTP